MTRIATLYLIIGIILGAPSLALASTAQSGQAVHSDTSEYDLKAAHIFTFIQFTEWPHRMKNAEVTVLVSGDAMVRNALQRIAAAAGSSGRSQVHIDPCANLSCLEHPQVLFIGGNQEARVQHWLDSTKKLPILTVSDIPGFADKGGMIELVRRGDGLAFRINRHAIADSGLYVSAQLLQLGENNDGKTP